MGKELSTEPKVVSKHEPMPEPDLPPAGDERREVLAERTDTLAQQAEELAAKQEVYAMDPAALEPDNDIMAQMDSTRVSNQVPGRAYSWVPFGQHGQRVQFKLAQGWRVVQGSDPEAKELEAADRTRRLGDVLLMWIPIERKQALDRRAELQRRAREEGVSSRLLELRDRYSRYVKVYGDGEVPEHILKMMGEQAQAKQIGGRMLDKMLRRGNVPGMPAPRKAMSRRGN